MPMCFLGEGTERVLALFTELGSMRKREGLVGLILVLNVTRLKHKPFPKGIVNSAGYL